MMARPEAWDRFEADARNTLSLRTVWRGQWCGEAAIRSVLPTIAFGTRQAADIYASSPNDRTLPDDRILVPRLFEARLDVDRVYCRTTQDNPDPWIDLDAIGEEFGVDVLRAIARDCAGSIEETGGYQEMEAASGLDLDGMIAAWEDLGGALPPVQGHEALRVPEFVKALQEAGYDAVMIGGCGMNALEPEWHIFDATRAVVLGPEPDPEPF